MITLQHFLLAAAGMFWDMFWALAAGFIISSLVMVYAPRAKLESWMGDSGPFALACATFFGAISSSCSYAAASMGKSLFLRGANIIPALVFMLASTNLVFELSAVLWTLLGWQFVVAEIFGGLVMIATFAGFMRMFVPTKDFQAQREEMKHEHAPKGSGLIAVAIAFRSEVKMLYKDILLGVILGAAAMVFIPSSFWQILFLRSTEHPFLATLENALIGPLVAVLSSVCSVGNIPLAKVLYGQGISFAGAISFIFADLIILPLLLIYRRYYGTRLALWIFAGFYSSMVVAGLVTEGLFEALRWIPKPEPMSAMAMSEFNEGYKFWLNLIFFLFALGLFALGRSQKQSSSCCH